MIIILFQSSTDLLSFMWSISIDDDKIFQQNYSEYKFLIKNHQRSYFYSWVLASILLCSITLSITLILNEKITKMLLFLWESEVLMERYRENTQALMVH